MLRDDGTYWLNLGDAYAGGGSGGPGGSDKQKSNKGSVQVIPGKRTTRGTGSGRWGLGDTAVDGLPAKNLMGQPWRAAFALQDDGANVEALRVIERTIGEFHDAFEGEEIPPKALAILERLAVEYATAKGNSWYLRSAIVWHKPNPMPESVSDRPTSAYEMVFLLTKRAHYFYDADAVREAYNPASLDRYKYKNQGSQAGRRQPNGNEPDATVFDANPTGRNSRNVWVIPTQGRPEAHFATFADELPRRCILAGTSEHGVCAECGAPWAREVEASGGTIGKAWHDHDQAKRLGIGQRTGGASLDTDIGNGKYSRQTVGWQPTCECNAADCPQHKPANKQDGHGPRHAGFNARWKESGGVQPKATDFQPSCSCDANRVPATVLDCFVGSGTTVAVAQQLGRRGIGLDLNLEYLGIAKQRIEKVSLPLF